MLPPKGYVPKRVHVTPLQKFRVKGTFWMNTEQITLPKLNYALL
jgi:hypothetical protein